MKKRSIVANAALMLTMMMVSNPSWGMEIIENYEQDQGEYVSGKGKARFSDLVPVDVAEGFRIPEYEELAWKNNGENIQKGELIFDSNLALYYQVILPQDFIRASHIVSLELTQSTDFLPTRIDLTTYLDQQPNIIAQHFYRKSDGPQQYGVVVYRLFTQETSQERYIHMLMAKNLLLEDLKQFEEVHQSLTTAFLAKRGEHSFRSDPYILTNDLPALTPKELRDKMTDWLVDKSPFQVIPSDSLYNGGGEMVPMFWRLRWAGEKLGEIIVTAPINDLSEEDDEVMRAIKGNLSFSEVWENLKSEVKELNNVSTILLPFGQSETILGKTGAHWNLLQFNPQGKYWNVINYDPKYGWIYPRTSLADRLQDNVEKIESFSNRFLSHQDLMNTTNCGYFILSYIQFLTHGMKLDELALPEIINQFPLWLNEKL